MKIQNINITPIESYNRTERITVLNHFCCLLLCSCSQHWLFHYCREVFQQTY